MKTNKIHFQGYNNLRVEAEINLPNEIKSYALYAPCFTCTKDMRAIKYIANALYDTGIALFRFDFTGLGKSEGEFVDMNYSTNLINIRLAYEFMKKNFEPPKILIGHSLGGIALLQLANDFESVKAISVIASPASPLNLALTIKETRDQALHFGYSSRSIGGIEYDFKREFFEDLEKNNSLVDLGSMKKPVLVLHSPDDDTISVAKTFEIFEKVGGQKSFVTLNNFGHLLNDKKDSYYVGKLIANWAETYL